MSEISNRILQLITEKSLSYSDLSKYTGISKSALQRYATGETPKIPLDRLELIAAALGVSAAYLMGWENRISSFQPTKMTIGERIKQLRLERNLTQQELADRLGTSKQVISRYETNQRVPKISVAQEYARILGVSLSYLTDDTTENHQSAIDNLIAKHSELFRPKMRKVPLIGGVACGEPIYSPNLDEEFALINEDIVADFALVCKGDSMAGAGISDGDVVYLRKQEMVDNGQIAAVIIGEEVTLKRVYYYRDKNKLILQPENPAYEPLVYTNEELDEIRILGKAVAQLRKIR